MKFIRKEAKKIILSLKNNPEEWQKDLFTAKHVPTNLQLWVTTGFMFCDTWPKSQQFNLFERFVIYRQAMKVFADIEERSQAKKLLHNFMLYTKEREEQSDKTRT